MNNSSQLEVSEISVHSSVIENLLQENCLLWKWNIKILPASIGLNTRKSPDAFNVCMGNEVKIDKGFDEILKILSSRKTEKNKKTFTSILTSIGECENQQTKHDDRLQDVEQKTLDINDRLQNVEQKTLDINDRLQCVEQKTLDINDRLQDVEQKTLDINDRLQDVEQKVLNINDRLQDVEQKTLDINDRLQDVEQKTVDINDRLQDVEQKTLDINDRLQDVEQTVLDINDRLSQMLGKHFEKDYLQEELTNQTKLSTNINPDKLGHTKNSEHRRRRSDGRRIRRRYTRQSFGNVKYQTASSGSR
ncbi:hypothetical protein Bpfe_023806 [Biomphalaria pfeifferi]|uniref:t-SNARE coiled-coil homology domain-containing protein n=1 Tax=Biomphalaria pfeifferi TaxID=112525 RepID=A0AAD8B2E2_BIOPF|nr:hypothetical protein Bpfe_023806 [Biomphalaria pfeifferi]